MQEDARQELHQKSLRNVRALLDKEEAEAARQKKATRALLFALVPVILLGVAVMVVGVRRNAAPAGDPKALVCLTRAAAKKSGEREREIRAQNPGMAAAEVGKILEAESMSIRAAAERECQATAR